MSLGSSVPWQEAMEGMTGQRRLDPGPLLEYFRPLHEWLREENRKNGVAVGWKVDDFDKFCEARAGASSSGSVTILALTALAAITVLLR